jgi:hypothetical protein
MAGAYEILAADYDWMFEDDALVNGRAINQPATARLLRRISHTSAVLDAACGTGVDAAVLGPVDVPEGPGAAVMHPAVEVDEPIRSINPVSM